MTTIMLPLTRGARLGGPALVLLIVGLILVSPIAWPSRLLTAVSVCTLGTAMWLHHLRRRPVSLTIKQDGSLSCVLADGHRLEVIRIMSGVVRPYLLSARLEGRARERCDLLVPGASLSASAHWHLRRALVRFRPIVDDDH